MLLHPSRAFLFGSRTNVFLFAKAETAGETRQVFHRRGKANGTLVDYTLVFA